MPRTMNAAGPDIEYRFNLEASPHVCPLCGAAFQAQLGSWPFLAGTSKPVCGGTDCPVGDDVTGAPPCDITFEFAPLDAITLSIIGGSGDGATPVAERLRRAAFDDAVPEPDRALLQRAAIDLQFCQADETRIETLSPTLVLITCGEAAAEMLLSGCGDIV